MSYFIYVVTSICLMTCQTALIPRLGFVEHFFDLLLPWVICLAAFRPVPDTLPVVLFVGVLMDALSGGPFGIYLTSYVWLFIAVRVAAAVVRTENPMVLILILIIAVVFQNTLFLLVIDMSETAVHFTGDRIRAFSEQIGWVLLTGPLLALGIRQTRGMVRRRTRAMTVNSIASEP